MHSYIHTPLKRDNLLLGCRGIHLRHSHGNGEVSMTVLYVVCSYGMCKFMVKLYLCCWHCIMCCILPSLSSLIPFYPMAKGPQRGSPLIKFQNDLDETKVVIVSGMYSLSVSPSLQLNHCHHLSPPSPLPTITSPQHYLHPTHPLNLDPMCSTLHL